MPVVRRNTPLWRRAIIILFVVLITHASPAHAAQVALAWDAVADPTVAGYIVEYGTAGAPYSASVNVGNATTWTFATAVAGTTYTFRVRAFNADGIESDPSNEVTATIPSDGTTSGSTSTSSCTTPDPFASMGGGTCYNGGWLPPGMPVPGGTTTTTTTTTSPTPAPAPAGNCTTPDPFASMGGGTCYNGGWLPPGMPVPGGTSTPTYTSPTPSFAPTTPTYAVPTSSTCTTPDPFATMGGGTCYNGGWLPPGMPVPGGGTTTPTPAPGYTPPPPSTTSAGGCQGTDPFASIPTLVGVCINGGWIPIAGQAGTVHADPNGAWQIVGDDGVTYAPTTSLAPSMQVEGLRLFFAGIPGTITNGATTIQILKIYAL